MIYVVTKQKNNVLFLSGHIYKKKHAQNGRIKGKVLYYKNLKVRKYSVFTYENIKQFLKKFFLQINHFSPKTKSKIT